MIEVPAETERQEAKEAEDRREALALSASILILFEGRGLEITFAQRQHIGDEQSLELL